MAERVYLISADVLVETGRISWQYMFQSRAPYENFQRDSHHFGLVTLKDKGIDYVDPYRLMRGEPGAIGSDGVQRWNINIMEVNNPHPLIGIGCDDSDTSLMVDQLRNIPNCVLLTHSEAAEKLKNLFERTGAAVTIFHYAGTLRTN